MRRLRLSVGWVLLVFAAVCISAQADDLPKKEGVSSSPVSAAGLIPIPNAPPATPKNFSGDLNAERQIRLSWTPNGESDLKGYLLFRGQHPGFPLDPLSLLAEIPAGTNSFLDVTLSTSYYYILMAVDLANLLSAPTAEVVMVYTSVGDARKNRPREFELEQNYPNPFNAATTISFSVSSLQLRSGSSTDKKGSGELAVYNIVGQKIRVLSSGEFKPGTYSFTWDGRDQNGAALPTGIYFYSLQIGELRQTKKMVLVK